MHTRCDTVWKSIHYLDSLYLVLLRKGWIRCCMWDSQKSIRNQLICLPPSLVHRSFPVLTQPLLLILNQSPLTKLVIFFVSFCFWSFHYRSFPLTTICPWGLVLMILMFDKLNCYEWILTLWAFNLKFALCSVNVVFEPNQNTFGHFIIQFGLYC